MGQKFLRRKEGLRRAQRRLLTAIGLCKEPSELSRGYRVNCRESVKRKGGAAMSSPSFSLRCQG